MLGQSWLNEALGVDDGLPDPTRPAETASICSVVQGFLRNEPGFSREDIAHFINEALQNEAGDLWHQHEEGIATAEAWKGIAERALKDLDAAGALESEQKRDAMLQVLADRYALGRADLGEAVYLVQRAKRVLLTPETCAWIVKLDHDKQMSKSIGLDVDEVFGMNTRFVQGAEAPSAAKPAFSVDFSRETEASDALENGHADESQSDLREAAPAPRRLRRNFREPRRAGDSVTKLVASLKQYHPAEERASARPLVGEPEVA